MLIEVVELNLSQVGLGSLDEFSIMSLFATAQAHCITNGTGVSLKDIKDKKGNLLYPGYYKTHLKVPPNKLLNSYQVWDKVSVGVEVKSYGGMILDSVYMLGRPGEILDNVDNWDFEKFPSMQGSNMFVIDNYGEAQVSIPRADMIAELPKLTAPPSSMDKFRKVRVQKPLTSTFNGNLRANSPINYSVVAGRDASLGHNIMFATFVRIMEYAERILLEKEVWPAFPIALLDCQAILERETYYFDNCKANKTIRVDIVGKISSCPANFHGQATNSVSVAVLEFVLELYEQSQNLLLAVSSAKKLIIVPTHQQSLLRDAERLLAHYEDKE